MQNSVGADMPRAVAQRIPHIRVKPFQAAMCRSFPCFHDPFAIGCRPSFRMLTNAGVT